jgi:hypothetical protein
MIALFKRILFLFVQIVDLGFGELFLFAVLTIVVNLFKRENLLNFIICEVVFQLEQLMRCYETTSRVVGRCAVGHLARFVLVAL